MNLYLVRHGEAAGGEMNPGLSARGINDAWRVAAFLRDRVGIQPVEILHSTKRRARETAAILREAMADVAPLRQVRGLTPNDPTEEIAAHLELAVDDLVVVSHLPFLERLASRLVVGRENGRMIEIPTAGVVGLWRATGPGTELLTHFSLRFFVTPELLA